MLDPIEVVEDDQGDTRVDLHIFVFGLGSRVHPELERELEDLLGPVVI